MANESFDISTGCDLQEVDNAVNQTRKELTQRYDFRGVTFEIEFRRKDNALVLTSPDEMKSQAIWDVLSTKMVKRGVPLKNLNVGEPETAGGSTVRQTISLQQGLPSETARKIVKFLKDKKLKKVQSSIQGDEVRVSSPSRDALQEVIGTLKAEDFGVELQFGNFRNR